MKTSKRDRVLLLLLPALTVAAIYSAFFSVGSTKRLTKARQQLNAAAEKAVSENAVLAETARLRHLKDEERKLLDDKERLQSNLQRLHSSLYDGDRQTETADGLTDLIKRHRLTLIKAEPVNGSNSVSLRWLNDRLSEKREKGTLHVFELQLLGSYADVASMLQELRDDPSQGIPVSLEMDEAPVDSGIRHWTIRLWM